MGRKIEIKKIEDITKCQNLELQIKKRTLELQILEADLRDYEPGPEQDPSLHQLLWCERNLKQSLDRVMARKNDLFGSNSRIQRQQSFQVPKHAETNSMEMSKSGGMLDSYNSDEKEFIKLSEENPSAGQLLRQLDPWISPYRFTFDRVQPTNQNPIGSSRVREGIFQLLDKAKGASANQALVTSNVPMTSLPTMHMSGTSSEAHLQASIPSQQPSVAYGQSPPILPNPQPGAIGNTPTVNNLKDGILPFNPVHSSQEQSSSLLDGNSQSLRASQSPSIERTLSPLENASLVTASTSTLKLQAVSEVPQPKDKRKVMSEYLNPNTTFLSLMNAEPVWQPSVDFSGSSNSYNDHSRDNNNNNNWGGDGHRDDNYFAAPEQVNLPAEAPQGSIFNDLCIKDAWEEQTFWTEGIQDRGLWEWDDLDLAGTLNLEDLDFFSKIGQSRIGVSTLAKETKAGDGDGCCGYGYALFDVGVHA
ncbi:hypothetical protein RJ639_000946 [Escallonia herrerae]|uniref:Uncharacterized protein n=1 Tax=Escallonia herrerae TaxID=1293975 RepID=A0AA88XAZ6_9ASTE|nr:hypothetical protein RJ639_000946 [Escallonia herrerae]